MNPYPPIYYPPPGYYAAGLAISFGVGIAMGAMWGGGWGWGCGWGHSSNVNININNSKEKVVEVPNPSMGVDAVVPWVACVGEGATLGPVGSISPI